MPTPSRSAEGNIGRGVTGDDDGAAASPVAVPAAAPVAKRPWPAGLAEQIKAVADVMAGSGRAMGLADLEASFSARGRWRERLPVILDTLEALGRVRRAEGAAGLWQAG